MLFWSLSYNNQEALVTPPDGLRRLSICISASFITGPFDKYPILHLSNRNTWVNKAFSSRQHVQTPTLRHSSMMSHADKGRPFIMPMGQSNISVYHLASASSASILYRTDIRQSWCRASYHSHLKWSFTFCSRLVKPIQTTSPWVNL